MNNTPIWKRKPFWIRLLNWEYWSFSTIYFPIYPVFFFLCLRARSFFFFAASNPQIKNGGFLAESKKDIFKIVPEDLQPRSLFFDLGSDPFFVLECLKNAGFCFPLIGKPDIGGRGRGVKKLERDTDVLDYVNHSLVDFHIQEFVPYEKETGIFYYRFPGQSNGHISGIVHKEFLTVVGNGRNTIRDLLYQNPRAVLQISKLELTERSLLDRILAENEKYIVVPYGNHARGALFLDDSKSVNTALTRAINDICHRIPDFYFGRLDIRYESRELLEQGKSFCLLEVNGAGSEPTHIYDPHHSIFFAWKEIIRHWILLYKISRANHKQGYAYLSIKEGLRMFREDSLISKKLNTMNTFMPDSIHN